MTYHDVAEPIEASSLYSDAPLLTFGFGVHFNVVIFLGQCMPRIFLSCLDVLTAFSNFWVRVHSSLL